MGFSQAGLLPVVEIPYAKYLDCGYDMFTEAVLQNWLSNGQQPNGMVVRLQVCALAHLPACPPTCPPACPPACLRACAGWRHTCQTHASWRPHPTPALWRRQGFGRGIFGGNYHTHNAVAMPPGLDVVCYSNGRDYARGFRYALRQARAGRVVMSVDCTALLNERHLHGRDSGWVFEYPEEPRDELTFDDVLHYPPSVTAHGSELRAEPVAGASEEADVVVVTYGDGVMTALRAARELSEVHGLRVSVVDTPCLSQVPAQLREMLQRRAFPRVVFADICKQGQQPLGSTILALQAEDLLPASSRDWASVAAANTYNPLGTTLTFLKEADVAGAVLKVCAGK